jgi:hypothetical protein
LWLPLIILDGSVTGWEPISLPDKWPMPLFNAAMSLFLTALILLGITLTSPLFLRVGSTCTVPASIIYDVIIGRRPGWMCYTGAALTVIGFLLLTTQPEQPPPAETAPDDGLHASLLQDGSSDDGEAVLLAVVEEHGMSTAAWSAGDPWYSPNRLSNVIEVQRSNLESASSDCTLKSYY